MSSPRDILQFWFSDRARSLWFEKDAAFDADIRARFGPTVHDAQMGGFEDWRGSPDGALALLLLLDQFARNIHRGSAKAYLGDQRAREVAELVNRNAPLAVRGTRLAIRTGIDLPLHEAEILAEAFRERVVRTDDAKEGPLAFVEKREPRWTGT